MRNYQLEQTPRIKLLNVVGRLFTIPVLENFLVARTVHPSSVFFKKLIPPDYLYKKNTLRYVTREDINYKLDISNVVDHYLYYGNKDASYLCVLDTIKNSKVILDIGANIGSISLYFAGINPEAQILSFEPHPDTFIRATENLKLNKFTNIRLINKGLGERKDVLKLYEVNQNNPGMNRILAEDKNLPFKKIEIGTLDNILFEKNIDKVDFIKLDVEGFEYSVLAGAKNTLQSKPLLFIELDDNNLRENNKSAKELIALLLSFSYKEIYRADNLKPVSIDDDFTDCHYDIIVK